MYREDSIGGVGITEMRREDEASCRRREGR
jgi:hypothetical protein